jgi:hypothetical protein
MKMERNIDELCSDVPPGGARAVSRYPETGLTLALNSTGSVLSAISRSWVGLVIATACYRCRDRACGAVCRLSRAGDTMIPAFALINASNMTAVNSRDFGMAKQATLDAVQVNVRSRHTRLRPETVFPRLPA